MLSRKRANKGVKRMNSLPLRTLSPVVISYATLFIQGKRYLQVPCNSVALNSNLGLFAPKFFSVYV